VAIIGTNGAVSAGSVPSGAAPLGAVQTADGAGGSIFVASKVQTLFFTNSISRTNNATTTDTNNNTDYSFSLTANAAYVVRGALLTSSAATTGIRVNMVSSVAGTNGLLGGIVGWRFRPNGNFNGDVSVIDYGGFNGIPLMTHDQTATTNAQSSFYYTFRAGASNSTAVIRVTQVAASTSNVTTMEANSLITLEQITP
jgi:hypothetical protein